jgi:hypothetical protein
VHPGVVAAQLAPADQAQAVAGGVACLPHGFGHGRDGTRLARANAVEGASYNDLSDSARLEGGCGNAALSGLPIRIEAI